MATNLSHYPQCVLLANAGRGRRLAEAAMRVVGEEVFMKRGMQFAQWSPALLVLVGWPLLVAARPRA